MRKRNTDRGRTLTAFISCICWQEMELHPALVHAAIFLMQRLSLWGLQTAHVAPWRSDKLLGVAYWHLMSSAQHNPFQNIPAWTALCLWWWQLMQWITKGRFGREEVLLPCFVLCLQHSALLLQKNNLDWFLLLLFCLKWAYFPVFWQNFKGPGSQAFSRQGSRFKECDHCDVCCFHFLPWRWMALINAKGITWIV